MHTENNELTEQETDLYDRQIRLWGLESQKRLKSSNVLLIGCGVLGTEIAKNIILAGIKSLTILDDKKVSERDISNGFMFDEDFLNKNRVDAIYEKAHLLNPMVELSVDSSSFMDKDDDFFKKFTLVCATECSAENVMYLNDITRKNNILFTCGDVYGFFGYFFIDFLTFEYTSLLTVENSSVKRDHEGNIIRENKAIPQSRTINYVPFHEVLNLNNLDPVDLKKMIPWYFLLKVLLSFQANYNRLPNYDEKEADIEKLIKIKENINIMDNKFDNSVFNFIFDVTVPVCSIIGGFLSQEIIKSLSQSSEPINNLLFFNFNDCSAEIACVKNNN